MSKKTPSAESSDTRSEVDTLISAAAAEVKKENLPKKPDELSQSEIDTSEKEKKRLLNESLAQDIRLRQEYATKIFRLIYIWLIALFILVIISGFFTSLGIFHIPTAVMTTIVGGTTINVLGIFYIVANYLFHRPK